MSSRLATWLAGAGVAVALIFAVAMVASADRARKLPNPATPQGTVRSFLSEAVVEQNPVSACSYLTARARKSVGPDQSCDSFFASARLDSITSDRQLSDLSYAVTADGRARVVRVDGLTLVLVPASPAALTEFHAPPTGWRIDSGVAPLAG